MLALYIVAVAIGGVMVLLSALGGSHDAHTGELHAGGDLHADADVDADADVGAGVEAEADAGDAGVDTHLQPGAQGADLPSFFGLRFWTYFSAFFGLSGLLLTGLTPLGAVPVAVAAVGTGLASGFGIATTMRLLTKTQASSNVTSNDLVGTEGTVLVPIQHERIGKIRCTLKGEVLDLPARTEAPTSIAAGQTVLIIGIEGHRVLVEPQDNILPQLAAKARQSESEGSR